MTVPGRDFPLCAGYGGGGQWWAATNLGDILERVLDKGLVIRGDIKVNCWISSAHHKIRLVIARWRRKRSGIDW